MGKKLSVSNLLGIKYLSEKDINLIFETSDNFKEVINRKIKKVPSLRDITIANLFFENSTRTKISFELAQKRLSADIVNFSSSGSSIKKGETLADTVNNILSMKVDMVVMRHPSPGSSLHLTKYIDSVVINAGDGSHEHPTQAILDITSLKERFGKIKGLKIGIIGDIAHSRVARSNIYGLINMEAEVMVCGPPTLVPYDIEALGVKVTHNLDEILDWADAINVLRIQLERMDRGLFPSVREYRNLFGITNEKLQKHNKEIIIMHPGPMNRGVEIDDSVADSDQAIILDQVLNGVASRMSILYLLLVKQE